MRRPSHLMTSYATRYPLYVQWTLMSCLLHVSRLRTAKCMRKARFILPANAKPKRSWRHKFATNNSQGNTLLTCEYRYDRRVMTSNSRQIRFAFAWSKTGLNAYPFACETSPLLRNVFNNCWIKSNNLNNGVGILFLDRFVSQYIPRNEQCEDPV